MAQAKETSSADKKYKIVKRLNLNDLTLSIGEDHNFSLQRTYVFSGKVGYSNWMRLKDLGDVMELLKSYSDWCDEHLTEGQPDKADSK